MGSRGIKKINRNREKLLKDMLERLYKCNEPLDIEKALNYFTHKIFYGRDLGIVLSIYFETREDAENLFLDSIRQNCVPDLFIEAVLAYCQNPVLLAEAFEPSDCPESTIRKYKRKYKSVAKAFADFDNHIEKTNAYYDDGGFFVLETIIVSAGGRRHSRFKVYKEHLAFVQALNNDSVSRIPEGSDSGKCRRDVCGRVRNKRSSLSGLIASEIYDDSNDISEFGETVRNEDDSLSMLQLVRPKEGELVTSEFSKPHYEYAGNQILYLSDLHLDHIIASSKCKTMGDVRTVLNRIGRKLNASYQDYVSDLNDGNVVVVIDGDITHSPRLFELFLGMNFSFLK